MSNKRGNHRRTRSNLPEELNSILLNRGSESDMISADIEGNAITISSGSFLIGSHNHGPNTINSHMGGKSNV